LESYMVDVPPTEPRYRGTEDIGHSSRWRDSLIPICGAFNSTKLSSCSRQADTNCYYVRRILSNYFKFFMWSQVAVVLVLGVGMKVYQNWELGGLRLIGPSTSLNQVVHAFVERDEFSAFFNALTAIYL
jgi:hypothetical protein